MANYGNMSGLWDYLMDILEKVPNKYKSGGFGKKDTDGKTMYDCICIIKSYPWCNGVAGAEPKYKANDIADDWLGNVYIYASKKSTNMSEIPTEGIWLVYLNNEHVGVYNAATGTVIEARGGSTGKVVERDLHYYDGTQYAWNKWSDLYWCSQGNKNTRSTIVKQPQQVTTTETKTLERVQIASYLLKSRAVNHAKKMIAQGYPAIIKKYGLYYRVQVGAFSEHSNAVSMLNKMIKLGYSDAFITEKGGTDVAF